MNQSVPLAYVFAGAAAGLLIWAAWHLVGILKVSAERIELAGRQCEALGDSIRCLKITVDSLDKQIAEIGAMTKTLASLGTTVGTGLESVPKLLNAVMRISGAQLEILQKSQNPFGRPNKPAAPRDPVEASNYHDIQERIRAEGISPEQAALEANSANTRSVWDGAFFEDWAGGAR